MDKINGISSDSVQKATGKSWEEWTVLLDKEKQFEKPHKEIVLFIAKNHKLSDWWSQMVTVGYEKAKGLRGNYKSGDSYQVTISKTVSLPLNTLYQFFADEEKRKKWLPNNFEITSNTQNKYVRGKWEDGKSHLAIGFFSKGKDKSQVAINHEKLQSEKEVETVRSFWKNKLDKLFG